MVGFFEVVVLTVVDSGSVMVIVGPGRVIVMVCCATFHSVS